MTSAELDTYLQDIVDLAYRRAWLAGTAFELLYHSGARYGDARYFHTWHLDQVEQKIEYAQEKTGAVRVFPAATLPAQYLAWIEEGAPILAHLTYSTARRHFQAVTSSAQIGSGKKSLQLHLFRHAYARRLQAGGATVAIMKERLGLASDSALLAYLATTI